MGRVKQAAAEHLAAVDGAAIASPAPAAPAGRAESSGAEVSPSRRARLPSLARFALVVILGFALSSLGQSLLALWTQNELASIAKPTGSRNEMAVLAAWRLLGLALGWFGNYDGYDLAALALLSHGPTTLLVSVFYGIRALTAGAYLGVDIVSAFLPFLLLRGLSGAHSAAPGVANREIVVDRGIQLLTSLHAALVYGVALFLASRTDGLPSFGFGTPTSQVLSLLFGLAARTFIFTPLVATGRTPQDQKNADFDPVSATLGQTVAWNLWGYTTQTKVSIRRTAVAMLFTAVGTFLNTVMTVKGVEPYGAAVYASIWVAAALVTGLSLIYVGGI
ncbi:hypothetical protein MMYC01_206143 [Madurella mycetomatis]|uniref:Uncharacterized protein n=1 Tax=Madurella mycetomatis TaxID=100816 RepID=A0A175VZY3_9PEZI|nr:hypothetical protein MMYC01_206143 [Madurella mycetomatis]